MQEKEVVGQFENKREMIPGPALFDLCENLRVFVLRKNLNTEAQRVRHKEHKEGYY
jgi:hypothetical protein